MTIELQAEPLISMIVPIYKKAPDVLKRCLMSLEDQDYPNMEVICVMDGPDVPLLNVATSFLRDKRFKIVEIDHVGACGARNAGFHASSGAIVSFFNSDYIAKPGMVRLWVTELLKHPDCGFVYGGYEYSTHVRDEYPSEPFDAWKLKQANYIDCGFPLWRKYVVEWDSSVKSLQDWDFWLRVVFQCSGKHDPLCPGLLRQACCSGGPTVKGHYLGRELSFVAQPPQAGGLSDDSHSNWVDRVTFVRKKNGIPTSEMCVTSLGAPFHGKEIAKMLGADFRDSTILKPHKYKSLYMIGFYIKPTDQYNPHAQVLLNFQDATKIVHFVGADIYWMKRFSHHDLKLLAGALNLQCDYILSETTHAQKELEEMGIHSEVMPIPPYRDYVVKPRPEKFKVAVFLTGKSDFDKYCREETLSIVRAMPDVEFSAYGDWGKDELNYPNLKHYGNIWGQAWEDFVYDHSCYLRLVRHDTRPMASDEFILAGRDVVTNIKLPYQRYIDTSGDPMKNEQDFFGTGMNGHYWPKTKKAIIQEIRDVRDNPGSQLGAESYQYTLDRQRYVDYIWRLSRSPKGKELVHA